MSAIWGICARNKTTDISKKFSSMTAATSGYKLDRIDTSACKLDQTTTSEGEYAALGCGHQYFTNEALNDVSPIQSEKLGVLFAADCFLYYREELINKISDKARSAGISSNEIPDRLGLTKLGDAQLAFYAFYVFGYSFANELRGSFSIAILDTKQYKLHLYTDHFARRYTAFHVGEDYVTFGCTYRVLEAAEEEKFKVNQRAVAMAYSNMSPPNFLEPETTICEGVFHLDAAKHYTIDLGSGEITKEQYWNPRKDVKKLKGKTDDEYKAIFLDRYRRDTEAMLRSRKETGIMLSGGLDSASVLAMAAPCLKAQGKTMYSYTTVPCSTFKPKINYSVIEDESFLIKEQRKFHDNLEPRFIAGDDDTCLDGLDDTQRLLGMPIKAVVNTANIVKMSKAAVADDCLLLLSGASGNASVSYGYTTTYIGLCVSKGKFVKAIKEAKAFCKLNKYSRKKFLKEYLSDVHSYLFKVREMGVSMLNDDLVHKYKLKNVMKDDKKTLGSTFVVSEKKKRNYMFIPLQYIQRSVYYTALSLQYGYIQLDPTLTVELVELCMSLPDECFANAGSERRLVRDYMKDLLPAWITDYRKGYGVQSSDFNFRINRDWDRLKDDIYEVLAMPELLEYFKKEEIDDLVERIRKNEKDLDWNTAWYMCNVYALGLFMRGKRER